ncbi:MAG: VWA domain-containing protein [Candidatus Aminicenantes bacterium]|nr:MAG: VWA domain-containing protein [Candidatus Aminicenantes bacterium]
MSVLITTGVVILVVLYMTYPRFLRRRLSGARFFKDLPLPRQGQSRLRYGKLELTLPFFLQLFVLLLLLAAVFFINKKIRGDEAEGLGLWFIVDTSASMSTRQGNEPRMSAAVREVELAVDQAQKAAKKKELCFRLSAMDLERRDLVTWGNAFNIRQAVQNLKPRPLGTDLGIIHRVFRLLKDQSQLNDQCRVSHIVVVTDIPAPAWLWESENIEVVWRDIGQPVDNLGFTNIRASRNPLTGLASEVLIEVTVYGTPPADARILVTAVDNDNIKVKDEVLNWQQGRSWQGRFVPAGAGQYQLKLSPGGAYTYDDTAVIEIDEGQEIRVDWQLADRGLLRQIGWVEDKINPHLRVTSDKTIPMDIPTLIVGPGYNRYGTGSKEPSVIRDFMETSPLLADVNLDAVETLGLRGIELPGEFQPVLRGIDGTVWLGQAENPLRAFVPGLPTGTDDTVGRFSATVFFNAVRWLLQKRDLPPVYTLTSPHAIEPAANRLVLHKDEGNTQRVSRSSGKLEDLKPVTGKGAAIPLWPILLMAAVVLFLIERAIAAWSR